MIPAERTAARRISVLELVAGCGGLVVYVGLAALVDQRKTQQFDDGICAAVHGHSMAALTSVMRGFTLIGQPAVLVTLGVLMVVWLARAGRSRDALHFCIAVLGSEALDQAMKLVFHRARPAAYFGLAEPMGYSFPSGHALVSCTFFVTLAAMAAAGNGSRARRSLYYAAAGALTLAIGFSRIYLGVHYPTDVLAGYALAVFWMVSVSWVRMSRRLPKPTPPARNT